MRDGNPLEELVSVLLVDRLDIVEWGACAYVLKTCASLNSYVLGFLRIL